MDYNNDEHIKEKDFFSNAHVVYSKSKEEIWDTHFDSLEPKPKDAVRSSISFKILWAASIVMLIGITFFSRLYTTEISTSYANETSHTLPDGSVVHLNSDTKMSYHPYWWFVDRSILFEGEAFYEVKAGSKFTVSSALGSTEVLGTSFNISTRNGKYKVYCKTGKVKISNNDKQSVIINPGMEAVIEGQIKINKSVEESHVMPWKYGNFYFSNQPLAFVLEEIQRHYNIKIVYENDSSLHFSGAFKRSLPAADVLSILSKTLDINVDKRKDGSYIVLHP